MMIEPGVWYTVSVDSVDSVSDMWWCLFKNKQNGSVTVALSEGGDTRAENQAH